MGRCKNKSKFPFKRATALFLALAYLIFGFLLWLGTKIFSSKPAAYKFARVLFKWPMAIFKIFGALKTGSGPGNANEFVKLTN